VGCVAVGGQGDPLAIVQANVDAVLTEEHAGPDDWRTAALVVSRATAGPVSSSAYAGSPT
jgi:hypothetical protein